VSLGIIVTFLVRLALVALFLPFSALDKVLNFRGAVRQASEVSVILAPILVLGGLGVEVLASLGILTGVADRLAAFVLSGYCVLTALLWKRFWAHGDFWSGGRDRELFWDFLKNARSALASSLSLSGQVAQTSAAFSSILCHRRGLTPLRRAKNAPGAMAKCTYCRASTTSRNVRQPAKVQWNQLD
jgi:putative oxidoreductase